MRLSILVWDPSSPIQLPLPICEIPFHRSDFDGQMLLAIMDEYLYHASSYVTGIIFDAASAHQCFRRAMMGIPNQDDMILLQNKNFKVFRARSRTLRNSRWWLCQEHVSWIIVVYCGILWYFMALDLL